MPFGKMPPPARDPYDIFERQNALGRSYLRPMGATPLSANGTVFKIYQTGEGDGKPQKSLVIVACDNRSGTLDRCELTYTRRGANGPPMTARRPFP